MKTCMTVFMICHDDACNISLNIKCGPICQHKEKEQEDMAAAFLKNGIPFQSGKWGLVAFATKKTKRHYGGVIASVSEFARRAKSASAFIWPKADDISEIETEDVLTFLPEPVESKDVA